MQKPFRGRAVIEERSDSLLVQIPTAKSWFMLLFLPLWLCGWGFGVVMVGRSLLEGRTSSGLASAPPLFLLVWGTAWIIGGGFALLSWVRLAVGVEVSEFTSRSIAVGEKILMLDRGRSYDQLSISRLRTIHVPVPSVFDNASAWNGGAPSLGFDYGARTIRFGKGIDEAEAHAILERVVEKFPQYG
jgi:hypothetical protein